MHELTKSSQLLQDSQRSRIFSDFNQAKTQDSTNSFKKKIIDNYEELVVQKHANTDQPPKKLAILQKRPKWIEDNNMTSAQAYYTKNVFQTKNQNILDNIKIDKSQITKSQHLMTEQFSSRFMNKTSNQI